MPGDDDRCRTAPLLASGPGSLGQLPDLVDRLGVRTSLLVVGPGMAPVAERVRRLLGRRCVGTFSDALAHVPAREANLAVASAQEVHADSVVGIGGGSAAGYAKIVALALRLPRIAVPATLSGAELTSRYLVTTAAGKEGGSSPTAAPRAVVRDPDLLAGVPARVLASSGMSAVGACVEVLAGPSRAGRAEAAAGLRLLWETLPRLVRDPAELDLRVGAQEGAALAGRALEAAGPGPAQLVAEDLGAAHRLDHGALMACLVPHRGAEADLAGLPGAAALHDFAEALGLPVDLGALCPTVDADALVDRLARRPDLAGQADPESMLMLLKEALR
ncbi:iron-containing alcohol dehydrogenase [Pseudonocardia sp. D17]|uniref:iron-containing alcohol dehydrogenase n=1 Tax=Pseudonocardia sp. D17 TaxID=882661 RepID=UPI0030D3F6BF|nr:hypothetical protein PSD17_46570 [Pseudonocardia sp. D17]